ncbi:MAG: hypothetical protein HQM08_28995 [Candidatus Riflebacteria bacterium]|nr:hypothetical protein [Candidatus Riflebacteria bacterium]
MLDPDQKVRGSGAWLLSLNSSLSFFPSGNLRTIQQINSDFIESRSSSLGEYCKFLPTKKEVYELAVKLIEAKPPKNKILLGALHGFARGRNPQEPSSGVFHQKFATEMHRCSLESDWEVKELYNITTMDRYKQINDRLSKRGPAVNYEVRAFCNCTSLPVLCPLIIGDQDAFLGIEDDKYYQVKSAYHHHGKIQIKMAEEYFSKLWNLESTLKIWIDGKLNLSELAKLEEQIKTIKI